MKRKECEKENASSGDAPCGKRRKCSNGGVLGEIFPLLRNNPDDEEEFVLGRRKLMDPSHHDSGSGDINSELSEELVLRIFSWLDKGTLGRCARVCKTWNRLSQDEALWKRLDLGSKTIRIETLERLASRGLVALRLAKAFILPSSSVSSTSISTHNPWKLQYLDLSMAEISLPSLKAILRRTQHLKKVALEQCQVDEEVCQLLSQNTCATVLHLAMAKGLTPTGLRHLLSSHSKLEELNIAWTELNEEGIAVLASEASPTLLRLNMAGCKEYLTDKHLQELLQKVPHLMELDISDAGSVSEECIDTMLLYLKKLEHLRVSRCYGISPNAYITLGVMNNLKYLTVFGVMKEAAVQELRLHLPGIVVNKHMFSTVSRPTVGIRKTSIWNIRVRD